MFLAVFLSAPLIGSSASAADNPKVLEAMASLKAETAKLGAPKLDGENLLFGTTKMNDVFTIVDAVNAKHGSTATLFAKKGTNFVRVSTNVMKEGKRAVGSNLDTAGPAYAAINQGKAFYGLVDILGKTYDTGYEPVKSEAGDVIGIYYVGFLME
jgi:hypothetical protein